MKEQSIKVEEFLIRDASTFFSLPKENVGTVRHVLLSFYLLEVEGSESSREISKKKSISRNPFQNAYIKSSWNREEEIFGSRRDGIGFT